MFPTLNPAKSYAKEFCSGRRNAAFGIINQSLSQSPWLVGERTGITDIYLAMLLTWYPDQPGLYEVHPNLRRTLEHALALEGVNGVFADNELI